MKYYLFVLGCAMNQSDAERISSVLSSVGYVKTETEQDADLIVVVACSVRQTAIDRIYGKIKRWQKLREKNQLLRTVLTGCVLEKDRKKMSDSFDVVIDIDEITQLPRILGKNKKAKAYLSPPKFGEYLKLAPIYDSTFRAFVPIMTGCNNYCSYCAVPYTRGPEKSRPRREIITEISALVDRGYKEVTLLGQNVNSYKYGFGDLLKEIDSIEGEFRVYFYSNHPKDMSSELIRTLACLKHFPHYVHLPLQSGDDGVLRRMNRHYTKRSYLELVEKLRKAMPDVTLTTDIIVGFPGETQEAFEKTKEVMEKVGFDMAYVAQYSPRPGALSANIADDVPKAVKKIREKELIQVLKKTLEERNKKLVGKKITILVDEKKNDSFYGRTDGYKVVEIKTATSLEIGQFYEATICDASSWKFKGTILGSQS